VTFGIIALALAWKFVAPDSPQVVSMEWKRVLESPLSASLRREIPAAAVPVLASINFIEGIERVVWTPGMVVMEGVFDLDKLKEMATADGGAVKLYKKAELLAPAEQGTTFVGLVSPNLILLGREAEIKAAIDRSEKGKEWGPPGYDLWIRTSGSGFTRHDFAVRTTEREVQLSSRVSYATAESARTASDNAPVFGLSARQGGTEAILTGSFSRDEFAKRQWRPIIESLHSSESLPATEAEPRKPGVIRIYGLDEGVKEIPLK